MTAVLYARPTERLHTRLCEALRLLFPGLTSGSEYEFAQMILRMDGTLMLPVAALNPRNVLGWPQLITGSNVEAADQLRKAFHPGLAAIEMGLSTGLASWNPYTGVLTVDPKVSAF